MRNSLIVAVIGLIITTSGAAIADPGCGDVAQVLVPAGKSVRFTLRQNLTQVAHIELWSSRGGSMERDTPDFYNSNNQERDVSLQNPIAFSPSPSAYCVKVVSWYSDAGQRTDFGHVNSFHSTLGYWEIDWYVHKGSPVGQSSDIDTVVHVIPY